MKTILSIILVLLMASAITMATSAPAVMTQTTPTTAVPVKAITWTSLTSSAPLEFMVSEEGFQVLLINATNSATITIPKGVGQRSPLGDYSYNVTAPNSYALKLETARFEQNNGSIIVDTSATVKAALVNLHPLFY